MNACRRAALGQNYYPQPAIWKISDGDTVIYLLGTVHRLPSGFDWRSDQLDAIIGQAGSLITENGLRPKRGLDAFLDMLSTVSGTQAPLRPISERLQGEQRAKWIGMASMLPESAVQRIDRMPDWLAALAIGSAADRAKNPLALSRGVDAQLESEFVKAKKPVAGMEDPKTVVTALAHVPASALLKMLQSTMNSIGQRRPGEKAMTLLHRWARGESVLSDDDLSQLPSELRQQLLDVRNAAWVNVVKQRLQTPGITLIAVGAAHLHGHGSLLDLLDKEGVHAERISPTTAPRPRPEFRPMPKSLQECPNYLFGKVRPEAGAD